MATLQDIADRVDLSTATVSKVLRGKIKGNWAKSAERIKQIQAVAQELGYQVDWRARALKTKRTYMIGLLSTDRPETRTHNQHLLDGIIETLGAAGYNLVFYRVPKKSKKVGFADARFDGVIVDYHIEPEEIALIEQAELPAVIVNAPNTSGILSVMPDHLQAGQLAAQHLIDLGHKRIAYIQPTLREGKYWPMHMLKMWREGIRQTMNNAGLGDSYIDIIPDDCVYDLYAEAFVPQLRESLTGPDRPTALIVNSPARSLEFALNPILDMGLSCPGDISIVSMGDEDLLKWSRPPITAVKIPFFELGQAAAKALLEQIDPPSATAPSRKTIELPVSLIERRSSAAVAAQ